MDIKIEKVMDYPHTKITITIHDDYLLSCKRDPYARLIERISLQDQMGLITDAVHTFMGVLPPDLKERNPDE